MVDPISIDAVALTNSLLENSGYIIPGKAPAIDSDRSTLSKKDAAGALGDVKISVLKSDGLVIEEWVLNNPFLKTAKYGDLDYSNDDLREIEMTFRYDWATCDTSTNPDSQNGKEFFSRTSS